MKQIFVGAFLVVILSLTFTVTSGCVPDTATDSGNVSAMPQSASTTLPTILTSPALDGEESAFVTAINDYRIQNGLGALQVSAALTQSSKWLSLDMATKNYFSHTDSQGRDPFTRMAAFGYNYSGTSGENIAAGNALAQATFTQWQNSPAHNANMLQSSYQVIGVGRASSASSSYTWYWTTDFGSTIDAILK